MVMKLKIDKGPLGKDKRPFRAGNLYYTTMGEHEGKPMKWKACADFTMANLCKLVASKDVLEIEVIDMDNQRYTLTR